MISSFPDFKLKEWTLGLQMNLLMEYLMKNLAKVKKTKQKKLKVQYIRGRFDKSVTLKWKTFFFNQKILCSCFNIVSFKFDTFCPTVFQISRAFQKVQFLESCKIDVCCNDNFLVRCRSFPSKPCLQVWDKKQMPNLENSIIWVIWPLRSRTNVHCRDRE